MTASVRLPAYIIPSAMVKQMNKTATHFVILASRASHDRAWFFERKASAAPEMAPDSPARLPDWKSTTRIKKTDVVI
jgi:hypothetical protein